MEKAKEWKDLWEELVENVDKGAPDFELYNPQILIDDILDEIEFNSFQNNDNRAFFYEKLSAYFTGDQIISNLFHSQFKLLRKDFNSDKLNLIKQITLGIKQLFENGSYFKETLSILKKTILTNNEFNIEYYNLVKYLSLSLIIEFIKKGYAAEDIKNFPKHILSNYEVLNEEIIVTDFPHDINEKDFMDETGIFNFQKYKAAIIEYIDNLSLEERLNALLFFYEKKKEPMYYLFSMNGIKGQTLLNLGDVTFYSSDKKSFLSEESKPALSMHTLKDSHIQVAVKVNYLMPQSTLQEAVSKVENALDLISSYFTTKTALRLNSTNYTVVDLDGNFISGGHGRDKEDTFLSLHNALDAKLIEPKIDVLNEFDLIVGGNKGSQIKISNSLHWHRKGIQSLKHEDKILNYWISLENLFFLDKDITNDILTGKKKSKIHLIQESVSSAYAIVSLHDPAWELFHYFNREYLVSNMGIQNLISKMDNDLIERSQINLGAKGGRVYLENFIDCLDEIRSYITDPHMTYRILNVQKLYNDPNFLKKHFEKEIEIIKNNLLLIYRCRNMIVHNAHYGNMLLPYLANTIKQYSNFFIHKMISEYNEASGSLSEIILKNQFKKDCILADLESGQINILKKDY
ncbi:hypothetical protein [Pedobacter nyackensis]|uniref:hypothetical protein n=1 Tax=Pedobacter nyackensis TaxID=475255 RepID=UPI00292E3FF5|nr:hypothetical protein [Pedobacter nyackensis]